MVFSGDSARDKEPVTTEVVWAEQLAANVGMGFAVGSTYGMARYYWSLGPGHNIGVKPIILAEYANSIGKYALKCSVVTAMFTLTAATMSTIRDTQDSWNYCAGGAVVGAFATFNSPVRNLNTLVTKMAAYTIMGGVTNFLVDYNKTWVPHSRYVRVNESRDKFPNSPGPWVYRNEMGNVVVVGEDAPKAKWNNPEST